MYVANHLIKARAPVLHVIFNRADTLVVKTAFANIWLP